MCRIADKAHRAWWFSSTVMWQDARHGLEGLGTQVDPTQTQAQPPASWQGSAPTLAVNGSPLSLLFLGMARPERSLEFHGNVPQCPFDLLMDAALSVARLASDQRSTFATADGAASVDVLMVVVINWQA